MKPEIILSEREEQLLKQTVEEFIGSIQPVGSTYLKKRFALPYSPATIRNALARLEALGLLTHPYTSAGRIPTDRGYRYYVDHCLEPERKKKLPHKILDELSRLSNDVDRLLQATAQTLGKLSNQFGMVIIPQTDQSVLRDVELIPLVEGRVMMVLAMESGMVKSIVLNLDLAVGDRDLEWIGSILKEKICGLTLAEIVASIDHRLKETEVFQHEIVQVILNHSRDYFRLSSNLIVYSSSLHPLLNHPEFQDQQVLNNTLLAVEEGKVEQVIRRALNSEEVYWSIGSENE
ncbi:MAG: heat-inducible transcription repressor HrcA, partial [Candidatus Neomarinimicrobiota bacterium]